MERRQERHGLSKPYGRIFHYIYCLIRSSGQSVPWSHISGTGELLQCYWLKDVCMEREPLQIEVDVWRLCGEHPDKYSKAHIEGWAKAPEVHALSGALKNTGLPDDIDMKKIRAMRIAEKYGA